MNNNINHLSPFAKDRVVQIISIFCFGLTIGLIMSILANIFVKTVNFISAFREIDYFSFKIFGNNFVYTPVFTLIIAAILIIIIKNFFKIDRWNGPADTIYAAHRTDNELNEKTGYFSSLIALLSASGGASVGLYGPLVHLGGTIGTTFKRYSKELLTTDVFLGCGVAGAISAGFGAPLAGIIFAHEAILRHFSMRALAPIAIASFTATASSNAFFVNTNLFKVENASYNLVEVLPISLFSGPFFALVAILFMISIRKITYFLNEKNFSSLNLILFGSITCGVVGIFFPQILGLGTNTVSEMINNDITLKLLIIIFFLKILMTSLCLGCGLFGGIFSPAIFVGTTAGSILGKILLFFGINAGISVLPFCGMAAVGGAIIGAPITAVLIIIEITNSYNFGLVTMASVAGCCLITHLFFGHSFFDRQLIDRGINIHLGRGHLKLMEEEIKKYCSKNFCKIEDTSSVKDSLKNMIDCNVTEGYILDKSDKFLGKILINNIIQAKENDNILKFMQKDPIILSSDTSVLQGIEACKNFVGESIPVIDKEKMIMEGIISEADLFSAYLDLDKKIRDLESG